MFGESHTVAVPFFELARTLLERVKTVGAPAGPSMTISD
jgi:hypothetical protein